MLCAWRRSLRAVARLWFQGRCIWSARRAPSCWPGRTKRNEHATQPDAAALSLAVERAALANARLGHCGLRNCCIAGFSGGEERPGAARYRADLGALCDLGFMVQAHGDWPREPAQISGGGLHVEPHLLHGYAR